MLNVANTYVYSRLGESCLHCVRHSVAPKIAMQLIIGQNALFAFPGNGDGIGRGDPKVEVGPRACPLLGFELLLPNT